MKKTFVLCLATLLTLTTPSQLFASYPIAGGVNVNNLETELSEEKSTSDLPSVEGSEETEEAKK